MSEPVSATIPIVRCEADQRRPYGLQKEVAADVANSLAFFLTVFGPTSATTIEAVESPLSHGEAFAGLVQLSWDTFQLRDDRDWNEIYRAHEIAHQWWGTGVDFVSYHDQWLREGFSQYSALWYLQSVLCRYEVKDWED